MVDTGPSLGSLLLHVHVSARLGLREMAAAGVQQPPGGGHPLSLPAVWPELGGPVCGPCPCTLSVCSAYALPRLGQAAAAGSARPQQRRALGSHLDFLLAYAFCVTLTRYATGLLVISGLAFRKSTSLLLQSPCLRGRRLQRRQAGRPGQQRALPGCSCEPVFCSGTLPAGVHSRASRSSCPAACG